MGKPITKPPPQSNVYSSDFINVHDGDVAIGDVPSLTKTDVGGDDTFDGDGYSSYAIFGDGYSMGDSARGGNDAILMGNFVGWPEVESTSGPFFNAGVEVAGDAGEMHGSSVGGNDYIAYDVDQGPLNSNIYVVGDAFEMYDSAKGGKDQIFGSDAVSIGPFDAQAYSVLFGDAYEFAGTNNAVVGGADYIVGGDAQSGFGYDAQSINLIGGDAYALGGHGTGGNDQIWGGNADGYVVGDAQVNTPLPSNEAVAVNILMGDGYVMAEYAVGGADSMFGGHASGNDGYAIAVNVMSGDALLLGGQAAGGKDYIEGGNAGSDGFVFNLLSGDTFFVGGPVKFGADTIMGGHGSFPDGYAVNIMSGDALDFDFFDVLGANSLTLPSEVVGSLDFFGTANPGQHNGTSQYGSDTLVGGGYAFNFMVGDAGTLNSGDVGGNDVILAANTEFSYNVMIGDAINIYGGIGGKDTLISGQGDDLMWGDASEDMYGVGAADKFVFATYNGEDVVFDFRKTDGDKIDLTAFRGQSDFKSFKAFAASGRIEWTGDGAVIHLDANPWSSDNTVLLAGVDSASLTSACFIF